MKKIYSILIGLFIVFGSIAQETKTEIKTRVDAIRNETVAGANTKTRIANAYQEIADGMISIYPVSASGTDTYTGSLQGLDAYSGRIVFVVFANNNTGAATLNIGSIGAANIQKYDGGWTALEANDIVAGKLYKLYHDGTRFQIDLGGVGSADAISFDPSGSVSATNVQEAIEQLDDQIEVAQASVGISVEALGVAADGVTIVTDTLQAIINAYVGQQILIGTDRTKIFLTDKVLHIPDSSNIKIDGQILLDTGRIRPLLDDLLDGADYALVDDAGTYYKVGQMLTGSDDDQPVNGGGDWKTRKTGNSDYVERISGDTIFFEHPFTSIDNGGLMVAANAKLGQANSILSLEGDNITISGNGVLDGNYLEQFNIASGKYDDTVEDLRSSCGITMNDVSNIRISGITIRRMTLHGIATGHLTGQKTQNINIDNVTIDSCVDKSIALLDIYRGSLTNSTNSNGIDEGDVIAYNGVHDFTIDNLHSYGNRRYGFALTGQDNSQIQASNIHSKTSRNKPSVYNIYIQNQLYGTTLVNASASSENMEATWSRSTTTCTVTTPVSHNLTNGQTIYVTVTSSSSAFAVGSYVITTTGATTFTFTCSNAGFTTGTLSYVGMTTDGAIVVNSSLDVDIKNANVYNHPLASIGYAVVGSTVYAPIATNIRTDGLTIKGSHKLSTARAISISNSVGTIIQNLTIDGAYRLFNESGNDYINITDYSITGYTTAYETNSGKIRFSRGRGYVADNYSQATVPSGATQVVVNHLLDITPKYENLVVKKIDLGSATDFTYGNITSKSFTIYVNQDPGSSGARFKWRIDNYLSNVTPQPAYTQHSLSDFSAGVDGYSSSNLTSSGNNDGVTDGTYSFDDVLKTYATSTNSTHDFSKAIAPTQDSVRVTFKYLIPAGQTNVNGLRVYANAFGSTIAELTLGNNTIGSWAEYTTGYFTASSATIYFRLMKTFTTSYAGANSASDDILYLRDIRVEYANGTVAESNGITMAPTWPSGSGSVTSISTSNGLTGGPITTTGTISGINAAADGSTKGVATYTANDFDASSGVISTDYTNGQAASGSTKGFLTSADWTTFNNKQATGLSYLLASGGTLTGDQTISGAFNVDYSASRFQFTQGVLTSVWSPVWKTTPGAHTGMTAATEFVSRDFAGASQQWAAGTIATQRFNYFRGYTITGASASNTVTNAYTVYIEPSTQGSNAVITNNFALGIVGSYGSPLRNIINNSSNNSAASSTLQFLNDASRGGVFTQNSSANSTLAGASSFNINTTDSSTPLGIGTNSALRWTMSATGTHTFTASPTFSSTWITYTQTAATSGTVAGFLWTGGAHTALTASTESVDINYNLNRTVQFSTGAHTLQRAARFQTPTYSYVGASTLTRGVGFAVGGPPKAGTNATITTAIGLEVETKDVSGGSGVTDAYGLYSNAPSGATNNYALGLNGNSYSVGKLIFDATITGGGTTGNQTINKPSGTVNIAAAGTAVTVTNSYCTTSSIVIAIIRTNDATAYVKNVVPGSGSFTINLGAAATGEVSIGFIVCN